MFVSYKWKWRGDYRNCALFSAYSRQYFLKQWCFSLQIIGVKWCLREHAEAHICIKGTYFLFLAGSRLNVVVKDIFRLFGKRNNGMNTVYLYRSFRKFNEVNNEQSLIWWKRHLTLACRHINYFEIPFPMICIGFYSLLTPLRKRKRIN